MISLDVSLTLDTTTALYRQEIGGTVELTNRGSSGVAVPLAATDPSVPVVWVFNTSTGEEHAHRRARDESAGEPWPPGELPPGETVVSCFDLLDVAGNLEPGNYTIWVEWACVGAAKPARSNKVEVEILPSSPRALSLSDKLGGHGGERWALWVDAGPPEPELVRGLLSFGAGGGVTQIQQLGTCPLAIQPVIAAPVAGGFLASQWVAWIDSDTLHSMHVGEALGPSKLKTATLPSGARIVSPLHADEVVDTSVRQDGWALILVDAGLTERFGLQAAQLTDKRLVVGSVARVPGPVPNWIQSHVPARGHHFATFLQQHEEEVVRLQRVAWPRLSEAELRPVTVATWDGRFVAGGARLSRSGEVHGAALLWQAPEDEWLLTLIPWSLDASGAVEEGEPEVIEWPFDRLIRSVIVGVDDDGTPAVLLRDDEEPWEAWANGTLAPVPGEGGSGHLAAGLGFLSGAGDALMVSGLPRHGLDVREVTGAPLPVSMK